MKNYFKSLIHSLTIIGVFAILMNSCSTLTNMNKKKTTRVKDIDGNSYNTVRIGSQVWMAENLKTTKLNDGSDIFLETNNKTEIKLTTPSYCWYMYDSTKYANSYGALYNWYSVNTGKLCPIGWHVPTDTEWTILIEFLGGENIAGIKLKETETKHWSSQKTLSTNESGFTALPGGSLHGDGTFAGIRNWGFWWSSTEYDKLNAWRRDIGFNISKVLKNPDAKFNPHSVRCVQD